jgi:predicted transposase/invertase (TIGR01784 family)
MLMTEWDLGDAIAVAREEAWEDGREEGLAEGLRDGRAEGRLEVARKMKAMSEPIEKIHALTGLPPDEIERLQRYN